MAVIKSRALVWRGQIPYVGPVPQIVQRAIGAFRNALGRDMWVETNDTSQLDAWVAFKVHDGQACSDIGCQKKGVQLVQLKPDSTVFTAIHEMLHCAGFEHEQFHAEFAWDRTDIPDMHSLDALFDKRVDAKNYSTVKGRSAELPETTRKAKELDQPPARRAATADDLPKKDAAPALKADFMELLSKTKGGAKFAVAAPPPPSSAAAEPTSEPYKALKTERNKLLYRAIVAETNEAYMQEYLRELQEKTNLVSLTGTCDYDSIMMYSEFLNAVQKLQGKAGINANLGSVGKDDRKVRDRLSLGDIEALRSLYL